MAVTIPSVSDIVKPWVDVLSTHTDRVAPTAAVAEPESYIKWGKDSTFTYDSDFRSTAITVSIKNPDKPKRTRYTLDEEGRGYVDYKVENADDPNIYVIVRRCTEVAFSGPGDAQFTLALSEDTVGTKEGSGQIPSSPPLGEIV